MGREEISRVKYTQTERNHSTSIMPTWEALGREYTLQRIVNTQITIALCPREGSKCFTV